MNSKHHSQLTDGSSIADIIFKLNKLVSSKYVLKKCTKSVNTQKNLLKTKISVPIHIFNKFLTNNKAAQEFSRSYLFSQILLAGGDVSQQQSYLALQLACTDCSTINNKNYQKQSNATVNTPISCRTSAATLKRQNQANFNGCYKTQSFGALRKYQSKTEHEKAKKSTIVRYKFAQRGENDVLSMQNFTSSKTRAVLSKSKISLPTTGVPSAYQQHPSTLSQRLHRSSLFSEHSTRMSSREGGPDTLRGNISDGQQTTRQQLLNNLLYSTRSRSSTAQQVTFQENYQNLASFSTKNKQQKTTNEEPLHVNSTTTPSLAFKYRNLIIT